MQTQLVFKVTSLYHACAIVEGFSDEQHTESEELEAWAFLIKSGACWGLQGWYGRNAQAFIDAGIISASGEIFAQVN